MTWERNDELVSALSADFINCWIPVFQETLTGSVTSVTFSSIPDDFRTLVFVSQIRSDNAALIDDALWQANGDTANNYDRRAFFASGAASGVANAIATSAAYFAECEAANSRASNYGISLTLFPGYKQTDREKMSIFISTIFADTTAANMYGFLYSGRWRSTAAITSLVISPRTGTNFVKGSVFALYGIL